MTRAVEPKQEPQVDASALRERRSMEEEQRLNEDTKFKVTPWRDTAERCKVSGNGLVVRLLSTKRTRRPLCDGTTRP